MGICTCAEKILFVPYTDLNVIVGGVNYHKSTLSNRAFYLRDILR